MINKVILMGRLTADPELRQTQNGISSCRFTIAVDRNFADKNTGERQTDFINCVAWRNTAEFINKYFSKGRMICVEGSLRTGSYNDKKYPDVKHYTTDVQIDNAYFTGEKSNAASNSGYSAPQSAVSPQNQVSASDNDMSSGSLEDFEEILGDGDVPF